MKLTPKDSSFCLSSPGMRAKFHPPADPDCRLGAGAYRGYPILRVYIGHLRQKLEEDSDDPQFIVTEPGIGYRIAEN